MPVGHGDGGKDRPAFRWMGLCRRWGPFASNHSSETGNDLELIAGREHDDRAPFADAIDLSVGPGRRGAEISSAFNRPLHFVAPVLGSTQVNFCWLPLSTKTLPW